MKIVYMGTPDFAVAPLKALIKKGFDVVAVITAADKPAGRGQKMQESAVKKFAVENNLLVLQPEKFKNEAFLEQYRALNHDLNIVVAFRMLPKIVWDFPKYGTFNLHASLLPQYRGAAPINYAIMNGETETGVTTFFINEDIDTGNVLLQEKIAIEPTENAGALHDKLMHIGANLVVKTVELIEKGEAKAIPQTDIAADELKTAYKIFKEDCKLDFTKDIHTIYNKIRGLSPYPTAFLRIKDKNEQIIDIKIFAAALLADTQNDSAASFLRSSKTDIYIQHPQGKLYIQELQYPGKKRMQVDEFLRGYQGVEDWEIL